MSNNLEYYINKANWPSDLENAKVFAHDAISAWNFKEKAPEYIAKVDRARSLQEVQRIIIFTFLSGEGLSTTKRH